MLEQLAQQIAQVRLDHPVRVGIDGRTAAGKTTLADRLAPLVEELGRPVLRASADGFHRPRAERRGRGELSPLGYYLDAFDLDALRRNLLEPLGPLGDRRCRVAAFDLAADAPVDAPLVVAPLDAVLLVDGVFLFRPELNGCWDFRVFVRVSTRESLRRGLDRDGAWLTDARDRYELRYLPGEQLYLDAVRPWELADVVVENEDPAAPRLRRRRTRRRS